MTNFLWNAGTSNTGLLTSATTLLTTEMNSLANNATALSSVGGSSGVFTNSSTAQGMMGEIYLTLGAIGSGLSNGACLPGWFLVSPDGGSTFENVVSGSAMARPPDFVVPLPATTITAGWVYKSASFVMIPALEYKVFVQNLSGQSFAASGNTIKIAPYAISY